jgi:hypothetical protein
LKSRFVEDGGGVGDAHGYGLEEGGAECRVVAYYCEVRCSGVGGAGWGGGLAEGYCRGGGDGEEGEEGEEDEEEGIKRGHFEEDYIYREKVWPATKRMEVRI